MRRGSAASSITALHEKTPVAPERSSSVAEEEVAEAENSTANSATASQHHDILADLTKLQRDIDALRVQSEREKQGQVERGSVT